MRNSTRKVARMTVFGGSAVAVAVLAFASSLQSAGTTFPQAKMPKFVAQAASFVVPVVMPETIPVKATKKPTTAKPQTVRTDTQTVLQTNPVIITAVGQGNGNPGPRYPDMLRAAEVEGAVTVRFTTGETGRVDSSSAQIISSTHGLLTASVLRVLPSWRFAPNSTIQMPVVFVLANKTGRDLSTLPGGVPAGAMVVTGVPAPIPGEPKRVSDDHTFFEFQVEEPASPMPRNPAPRYPDALRAANVEGEVLAQFVVTTDGLPDMSTFKTLKSTDDQFTDAVRLALPNMRFYAAKVGGREVKQLIQMPFHFNLAKQP